MKSNLSKLFIILVLLGLFFSATLFNFSRNQTLAQEKGITGQSILEDFLISGRIKGKGTLFEIKDSEYLNIILKSSEKIKVVLELMPKMISLNIENAKEGIDSARLTIEGLELNKTYYKYQDSYKNGVVFVSEENGNFSWEQTFLQPHYIWFQEIKRATFISEDVTLDQDIIGSAEITSNNIILDCNGYKIIEGQTGNGIYLNDKTGATIKNCNIINFSSEITLLNSTDILVTENNINSNYYGIQATGAPNSQSIVYF